MILAGLIPILTLLTPAVRTVDEASGKMLVNDRLFYSSQVYEEDRVQILDPEKNDQKTFMKFMGPASKSVNLASIPARLLGHHKKRVRIVYREISIPRKDGSFLTDYQPISTANAGLLGNRVNLKGDPEYLEHYLNFLVWELKTQGTSAKAVYDLMDMGHVIAAKVLESHEGEIYRYLPQVLTLAQKHKNTDLYDQIIQFPSLTKLTNLKMSQGAYIKFMLELIHRHPRILDTDVTHVHPH
jgi:hypothetical protein